MKVALGVLLPPDGLPKGSSGLKYDTNVSHFTKVRGDDVEVANQVANQGHSSFDLLSLDA